MPDEYPLDFYFDRYQRFRAAAELVNGLGRPLKLLDVGGHDRSLGRFLDGHAVTFHEDLIERGRPAPFADGAFHAVLALDVLEHVQPPERPFFTRELARLSSRAVILSVPTARAAQAEAFVHGLTGSAWLAEHSELGLPEPDQVAGLIQEAGLELTRLPNACLPSWTAMMLLMHGVDKPLRTAIIAFFNERFYEVENREPAYRHLYLCRRPQESAA
jgi:hypothetical protein